MSSSKYHEVKLRASFLQPSVLKIPGDVHVQCIGRGSECQSGTSNVLLRYRIVMHLDDYCDESSVATLLHLKDFSENKLGRIGKDR